nr:MAG TPA: hypothetical protein [Caudoviricetes sp.]
MAYLLISLIKKFFIFIYSSISFLWELLTIVSSALIRTSSE